METISKNICFVKILIKYYNKFPVKGTYGIENNIDEYNNIY